MKGDCWMGGCINVALLCIKSTDSIFVTEMQMNLDTPFRVSASPTPLLPSIGLATKSRIGCHRIFVATEFGDIHKRCNRYQQTYAPPLTCWLNFELIEMSRYGRYIRVSFVSPNKIAIGLWTPNHTTMSMLHKSTYCPTKSLLWSGWGWQHVRMHPACFLTSWRSNYSWRCAR